MQQDTLLVAINKKTDPEIKKLDFWCPFLSYDQTQCSLLQQNPDQQTQNDVLNSLPTMQTAGINILYNELFFYTLFNTLYSEHLDKFWKQKEQLPRQYANIITRLDDIPNIITLEKTRAYNYAANLSQTLEHTMRQTNQIISSYPIHIGLLLYEESAIQLRDKLASLYKPFHQLHYKLENVQSDK